jgi:hypothetical protein
MATINTSISNSWVQVADINALDLLITWDNLFTIELATTATNTPPVVRGHYLTPKTLVTRDLIGEGYVWVKGIGGTFPNNNTLTISIAQPPSAGSLGSGNLSTQVMTYNGPGGAIDTVTSGPDGAGNYYTQTLSYVSGKLTNISAWIKQ